jgi:hypothetical protein
VPVNGGAPGPHRGLARDKEVNAIRAMLSNVGSAADEDEDDLAGGAW